MKTHFFTLLFATATTTIAGCGSDSSEVPAPTSEEIVTTPPLADRVGAQETPGTEPRVDVERMGKEGTTDELVSALKNPKPDEPIYVVVRAGVKVKEGHVVVAGEEPVARALRLEGADQKSAVIEVLLDGATTEATLALADLRFLKTIDLAYLGQETQRVTVTAVAEIDDFDLDEEARRSSAPTSVKGLVPNAPISPATSTASRASRGSPRAVISCRFRSPTAPRHKIRLAILSASPMRFKRRRSRRTSSINSSPPTTTRKR